ncbi:MAG: protein kinase [Deltaproteobacteria bacterium]|nr:protein kinase [Deltaproteobacteria bacterium]
MATCPECSAKTLPDQEVCRSCGVHLDPETSGVEPPDPMLGSLIAGKYRIEEWIGEGAMGRVYAARQESLDKHVAIKVLHPHLARDPKVIKRFHREARAASRLSHPNSMQVVDFGADEDGKLYIAMELLDGPDLLEVIEDESPLSPRRIGRMLGEILDALEAAHAAGIIHRDLKPENVMVVEDHAGRELVKVCDFGIAKIPEAEGGSAITMTGFVCGTPEYMAPEQARGEELDVRADLYAAGAMLYQLLTGQVPFTADSALGIITKHLTEPLVPPRRARPDLNIPSALAHVSEKALRKDRRRRYGSATEMKRALMRAVDALGEAADAPLGTTRGDPTASMRTGSTTRLPVVRAGSRTTWIALGLLALGSVALFFTIGPGRESEPDAARPPAELSAPPHPSRDAGAQDAGAQDAGAQDSGAQDSGAQDSGAQDSGAQDAGQRTNRPRRPRAGTRPPTKLRTPTPRPERPATTTPTDSPPGAASAAELAYAEARRLFLSNDLPGAIANFERAARLMPGRARVQKELGRAYMRTGDVSHGVAAYRRYLELAPNAADRAIVQQIIQQHGG